MLSRLVVSMRRLLVGSALAACITSTPVLAELHVIDFFVDGAQTVPPQASPGFANVRLTLDDVALTITFDGTFANLIGDMQDPAWHGPGAPGVSGPYHAMIPFTGTTSGTFAGTFSVSAQQADEILQGLHYIDLHTSAFPGGELRGQIVDATEEYCFGEAGACTPCPCANGAAVGAGGGCLNSAGGSGRLIGSGIASSSDDTLRFSVTSATPSTFGVLVSASNALPTSGACPPGSGVQSAALDGLRCVGGGLLRHGARSTDVNGDIGATTNAWGPPGGPARGLVANGGFAGGQTRHFQVFYREVPTLGCGTAQNTTNASRVVVTL